MNNYPIKLMFMSEEVLDKDYIERLIRFPIELIHVGTDVTISTTVMGSDQRDVYLGCRYLISKVLKDLLPNCKGFEICPRIS